jgi:hypothetical protein
MADLEAVVLLECEMLKDEESEKKNLSSADDDWVPVVASNKGNSMSSNRIQTSPNRLSFLFCFWKNLNMMSSSTTSRVSNYEKQKITEVKTSEVRVQMRK